MNTNGVSDLLADDVFCLDDGPRVLDCLEFDDHLRHVDVLDDIAFLAMDLERLGAAEAAEQLLGDYHEFTGDPAPPALLLNATLLQSDRLRKEIAGLAPVRRAIEGYRDGIYDSRHTDATEEIARRMTSDTDPWPEARALPTTGIPAESVGHAWKHLESERSVRTGSTMDQGHGEERARRPAGRQRTAPRWPSPGRGPT